MDQNTTLLQAAAAPEKVTLMGNYVSVEPLDPGLHGPGLWAAIGGPEHSHLWTYMGDGPFESRADFDLRLQQWDKSADPLYFAIVDSCTEKPAGRSTLMRIDRKNAVIEVGGIVYSRELQRSRGATEAMYLLARHVFEDLGYRRYEWKCNALNEGSRTAALRLGFTFEGIFRQHMIVKGRNRDTAWYSMLDSEWPARKREFERWLDPANFDADGRQKSRLNR